MTELDRALSLSWQEAWLTVAVTAGVYASVIALSRIFGQRQFTTTSSYDLAFVFALGGVVGRVVLVRVSLAGAVLGLATLFTLHAVGGWLHHHSALVHRFTQNQPIVIVADGRVLDEGMRAARISLSELRQQLRCQGRASLEGVAAAILERDGRVSVLAEGVDVDPSFLRDVIGAERLSVSAPHGAAGAPGSAPRRRPAAAENG